MPLFLNRDQIFAHQVHLLEHKLRVSRPHAARWSFRECQWVILTTSHLLTALTHAHSPLTLYGMSLIFAWFVVFSEQRGADPGAGNWECHSSPEACRGKKIFCHSLERLKAADLQWLRRSGPLQMSTIEIGFLLEIGVNTSASAGDWSGVKGVLLKTCYCTWDFRCVKTSSCNDWCEALCVFMMFCKPIFYHCGLAADQSLSLLVQGCSFFFPHQFICLHCQLSGPY